MAVNLSKMKAIRDAFHRTPCIPDNARYLEFEKSFTFDPTDDQKSCFEVTLMFCTFGQPCLQIRTRIVFCCSLT